MGIYAFGITLIPYPIGYQLDMANHWNQTNIKVLDVQYNPELRFLKILKPDLAWESAQQ